MSPNDRTIRLLQLVRAAETGIAEGGEGGVNVRKEIQELSLAGIPDEPRYLRPAIYHILLNLPPRSSILPSYTSFLSEISSRIAALPSPTGEKLGKEDQLLREIERDVERTFGELAWFGGVDEAGGERDALWDRLQLLDAADRDLARDSRRGTPDPNVVEEEKEGAKSETAEDSATTAEEPVRSPRPRTRRQALLRPLYIYSTLNPGVSYVQGMNSIVAVLSWILSASGESPLEVEASTFFALGSMLSQLRDLYVRSLDGAMSPQSPQPASNGGASMGLGATLSRYTSLLTWLDPNVAASLEHKQVDPALYVFKWLTTLFASDFPLPDLVRIWDRLFLLFPSLDDPTPSETLSPILGHLIDISLAMVLLERPVIVSPFSTFQKVIALLQSPQIEGPAVDRLLGIAWEIRERRIGKTKVAGGGGTETWRAAAGRWTAAANSAAVAASTGPKADSLRSRFWTTMGSPASKTAARMEQGADYDLDESMSVVSDTSASGGDSMMFASRGQRVGMGRDDGLRGKVLPPPPDLIDDRGILRRPPPPPIDEDDSPDDYTDSDEERDHAASSWSGFKSRVAASDAAASLFKATTNLSIQAQILREQVAEQAPERIARMKEGVTAAGGRFYASSPSRSQRPGGSPTMELPFTPPGQWSKSPRPASPPPFVPNLDVLLSPGTKPLLLSGSTRRAANGSQDPNASPPTSQRSSHSAPSFVRSPSFNDALVQDAQSTRMTTSHSSSSSIRSSLSTPPSVPDEEEFYDVDALDEGADDKTPTIPAGAFRPRSPTPNSFLPSTDDSPIQSRRLQDVPTIGLKRSLKRAENDKDAPFVPPTSSTMNGNGTRGWALSDAPVTKARPAALDLSFDPSTLSKIHDSPSTAHPSTTLPPLPSSPATEEKEILLQRSRVTRKPGVTSRRGSSSSRSTRSISSMHEVDTPTSSRPERLSSLSLPAREEEEEVEVIVGRPKREQRGGGRRENWDNAEQDILSAYGGEE